MISSAVSSALLQGLHIGFGVGSIFCMYEGKALINSYHLPMTEHSWSSDNSTAEVVI